ncbi:FAD-binding oxidoreductase [Nocardioides panacis]|nr:FAD-binding oxidoreductase [Nocardioides panacis]
MSSPMTETASGAPSGGWCTGVVREVRHPHPDAVLLRIEVAGRTDHLPGQHYVFRLRAEDGYTASRSYSVASSPADPLLEFWVERLDDGEVSPHLADVVRVGDELELRGPVGGWFVWAGTTPAIGVAGGTGVVPLVAMLRHARDLGREDLLDLVVSARTTDDVPYREELAGHRLVVTRQDVDGRRAGRVNADDLRPVLREDLRTAYVCGSTGFAETASRLLVDLGVPADVVRVERFGPTGT